MYYRRLFCLSINLNNTRAMPLCCATSRSLLAPAVIAMLLASIPRAQASGHCPGQADFVQSTSDLCTRHSRFRESRCPPQKIPNGHDHERQRFLSGLSFPLPIRSGGSQGFLVTFTEESEYSNEAQTSSGHNSLMFAELV
jgi:hypothetical protein